MSPEDQAADEELRARLLGRIGESLPGGTAGTAERASLPRRAIRRLWSLAVRPLGRWNERGIDTGGARIELEHFDPDNAHYAPSGWYDLRRALAGRRVSAEDVFLDLGAGKGRVMLQAARFPFARVAGIELSPSLHRIAEANVAKRRPGFACEEVELLLGDARDYAIPDDVTVVYLYQPFAGDVFDHAIESLVASLERRPRRLTLIYALPLLLDRVLATGRFRLVRMVDRGRLQRVLVGPRPDGGVAVLESTEAAGNG